MTTYFPNNNYYTYFKIIFIPKNFCLEIQKKLEKVFQAYALRPSQKKHHFYFEF